MTRARSLAEQAVNNVWLTLAQRVVTLLLVPILVTAFWTFGQSYMALRDRVTIAEGDLRVAQGEIRALQATTASLRLDHNTQAGNITRLQAQREGDIQISQRVNDLREEMRDGNARLNARLDAMMTPPQRMVPR